MLGGHESAGLTLDRYGHLYGSDVEAVGVAINALSTRDRGQNVVTEQIKMSLGWTSEYPLTCGFDCGA